MAHILPVSVHILLVLVVLVSVQVWGWGVTAISFSPGPLSPFSASFLRASLQSASTGPPGPYTILCLSTVSASPPLVQTLSRAQHVHRSWHAGGDT